MAESVDTNRETMKQRGAELSCATRIINILIRFWQHLSPEEYGVLESAMSPNVCDNGSQVCQIYKQIPD